MPMSPHFENRLTPILSDICRHFGTPFHIYDETGIRETGRRLKETFSGLEGFREYFAVKALPNPKILSIMQEMGFGFDCSSSPELTLGGRAGGRGQDLMFTSNNTSAGEFAAVAETGAILNLDDISLVPKVPQMPERISFRYNPGPRRTGNSIIGRPEEAKYGVSHHQIIDAFSQARMRGARRFGLHTMLASNECDHTYMVRTVAMLLALAAEITAALGITFEFINMGGGLGIPYRPGEEPVDLDAMGRDITRQFRAFETRQGYAPRLYMESGRYMTGPHGAMAVQVINTKDTYRRYIGVDASMSALMRPGIYGAYHHITVPGRADTAEKAVVDVVGSLCENNDKFAVQRPLPPVAEGDTLLVHDTGAHGHAMGFNYNGQLRPQELLLRTDGRVERIRREETAADYFATLDFAPRVFRAEPKAA
jgi:diaminopimelate decarboxylase